jgi:Leucine-rich repeat (LRR) protein
MSRLSYLDLSYNPIQRIPDSLSALKALQVLKLNQCQLAELPAGIGTLSALELLEAEGFFFNGGQGKLKQLPATLSGLSRLKRLVLRDNLIELLPSAFGNLTQLEELDLRGNLIRELPADIGSCRKLRNVYLKANEIMRLPEGFFELRNLEELSLAMNKGFDWGYHSQKLSTLKSLKFLDLSFNEISREEMEKLREQMPECKIANWDYWKNSMYPDDKK